MGNQLLPMQLSFAASKGVFLSLENSCKDDQAKETECYDAIRVRFVNDTTLVCTVFFLFSFTPVLNKIIPLTVIYSFILFIHYDNCNDE